MKYNDEAPTSEDAVAGTSGFTRRYIDSQRAKAAAQRMWAPQEPGTNEPTDKTEYWESFRHLLTQPVKLPSRAAARHYRNVARLIHTTAPPDIVILALTRAQALHPTAKGARELERIRKRIEELAAATGDHGFPAMAHVGSARW